MSLYEVPPPIVIVVDSILVPETARSNIREALGASVQAYAQTCVDNALMYAQMIRLGHPDTAELATEPDHDAFQTWWTAGGEEGLMDIRLVPDSVEIRWRREGRDAFVFRASREARVHELWGFVHDQLRAQVEMESAS